jgi:hypothetical protein
VACKRSAVASHEPRSSPFDPRQPHTIRVTAVQIAVARSFSATAPHAPQRRQTIAVAQILFACPRIYRSFLTGCGYQLSWAIGSLGGQVVKPSAPLFGTSASGERRCATSAIFQVRRPNPQPRLYPRRLLLNDRISNVSSSSLAMTTFGCSRRSRSDAHQYSSVHFSPGSAVRQTVQLATGGWHRPHP